MFKSPTVLRTEAQDFWRGSKLKIQPPSCKLFFFYLVGHKTSQIILRKGRNITYITAKFVFLKVKKLYVTSIYNYTRYQSKINLVQVRPQWQIYLFHFSWSLKISFVDSVEADAQIGLGKIVQRTIYLKRIWLSFKQGVGVSSGVKIHAITTISLYRNYYLLLTYLNMTASLKLINFIKYLIRNLGW